MTHVLLTRPLETSLQLASQLEALGLLPIVMPLYMFVAREPMLDMNLTLSGGLSLLSLSIPRLCLLQASSWQQQSIRTGWNHQM